MNLFDFIQDNLTDFQSKTTTAPTYTETVTIGK